MEKIKVSSFSFRSFVCGFPLLIFKTSFVFCNLQNTILSLLTDSVPSYKFLGIIIKVSLNLSTVSVFPRMLCFLFVYFLATLFGDGGFPPIARELAL